MDEDENEPKGVYTELKLYNFNLNSDNWDWLKYDNFYVLATSKEDAWKQIASEMPDIIRENFSDKDEFIAKMSAYDVDVYPLNKKLMLFNYNNG